MTRFEMVEKLREKANVSYEEAKAALEEANWDLLDAVVLLEKRGGARQNESEGYSTRTEAPKQSGSGNNRRNFSDGLAQLGRFLAKLIHRGNINTFEVERKGESIVSLPVTAFALLLFFAFWITLPLLIVGLFTGFHYAFRGPDLGREAINNAMNRASEVADEVKHNIKKEGDDSEKES